MEIGVPDKRNNKKNSAVEKKDAYNVVISMYLQKIEDQQKKLIILRKHSVDRCTAIKKEFTNKNNQLTKARIREVGLKKT